MRARYQQHPKIACPVCDSWENRVLPHKLDQGDGGYRRRRSCKDCGAIFETLETVSHLITTRQRGARSA